MARTFDSGREVALVMCACSGDSARKDLRSFRNISAELRNVLIVDILDLVYAKAADFPAASARVVSIFSLGSFGSLCHCGKPPFRLHF